MINAIVIGIDSSSSQSILSIQDSFNELKDLARTAAGNAADASAETANC